MNKFKFYFILLITTLSLFSCSKNDTPAEITPPREYTAQYNKEIADIESYLNTYYLDMDLTDPNFADKDVVIKPIPLGGLQHSIMTYKTNAFVDSTNFPQLWSRNVSFHGINYKLYYLVLREGEKDIVTDLGGQSPSNADAVLASYSGSYLQSTTTADVTSVIATPFEEVKINPKYLSLLTTIKGWGEIFPQFKTGSYTSNNDNTITYTGFGAGVMFIPSGLAYYNYGAGSIPSYAPLVFSFKLYEIQRLDSDGDGIFNYQEDVNIELNKDTDKNNFGYMYDYRNSVNYPTFPEDKIRYADDTDKDGIPNFVDVDDDGDGYTTKLESKRPDLTINNLAVSNGYYPFTGASVDNPKTLDIDERQGIPNCSSDFISPTRLRKYLDKSCH